MSGKFSRVDRVATYDASFAYAESEHVRSSIVTAYAFPESEVTTSELTHWLSERASGVGRLRQRMVRAYGDIGDAYWSESPGFDPNEHITVAPSMSWNELQIRIARAHQVDFDPSRPLWSAEIVRHVTGIEPANGRECVVVILKFHHGMTDGLGAANLAKKLFSIEISSCEVGRPISRAVVTAVEAARLALRPFLVVADVWHLLLVNRQISKDRAAGLWSMPEFGPRLTAINQPWSGDAVAEVVFASVSDLRRAAIQAGDASVNDVVLAAIGGAAADHLGEEHLAAAVPISVRDISADSRNATAIATVDLRADLQGATRIAAIHNNVTRERARFHLPSFSAACVGNILPRLPGFVYRALAAQGRRSRRQVKPTLTPLKISTIPKGPADGWVLAGSTVISSFGVPPLGHGTGLNHTVSRIGDVIAIGVTADPEQMPDLRGYVQRLRLELATLAGSTAA